MRTLLIALAHVCIVTAGCSSTPTSPTLPPFPVPPGQRTATWVGTLTDSANGQGRVSVVLVEAPVGTTSFLAGSWTATFDNTARNGSGRASGETSAGGTAQLFLTREPALTCPSGPGASFGVGSFFATTLRLTGNTMAGGYDYIDCGATIRGSLTLTRQ